MIVRKPSKEKEEECSAWPVWEKEVSTFPWVYSEKETCLIIEGKASVKSDDGEEIKFGKGDLVEFPAGLKCTWKITEPIKKHYKFG